MAWAESEPQPMLCNCCVKKMTLFKFISIKDIYLSKEKRNKNSCDFSSLPYFLEEGKTRIRKDHKANYKVQI